MDRRSFLTKLLLAIPGLGLVGKMAAAAPPPSVKGLPFPINYRELGEEGLWQAVKQLPIYQKIIAAGWEVSLGTKAYMFTGFAWKTQQSEILEHSVEYGDYYAIERVITPEFMADIDQKPDAAIRCLEAIWSTIQLEESKPSPAGTWPQREYLK